MRKLTYTKALVSNSFLLLLVRHLLLLAWHLLLLRDLIDGTLFDFIRTLNAWRRTRVRDGVSARAFSDAPSWFELSTVMVSPTLPAIMKS